MLPRQLRPAVLPRLAALLILGLWLSGCSTGRLIARGAEPVLAGGMVAMNRETDLSLARQAMPAQLKLIEGLLQEDPRNATLQLYAAQGFYGYAYAFVEDRHPRQASGLYERCYHHALVALHVAGLEIDPQHSQQQAVEHAVARLGKPAVPALFWTASCWAKWIDMNRDSPLRASEIGRVAALMHRVLQLDEPYYHAGADLFFAVYYSSRPPMLGGDYRKARHYFRRAKQLTHDRFYLVDVLYAQYLARQTMDRSAFEARLHSVLDRSADAYPDLSLLNHVAQAKARWLLAREKDYF